MPWEVRDLIEKDARGFETLYNTGTTGFRVLQRGRAWNNDN